MYLHRHHPLLATAIPLPVLPPRQRAETFRDSPSVTNADHRLSSLPYVVRPFQRVTAARCCYPPTFLHAYCSVLPICQRPWFLILYNRTWNLWQERESNPYLLFRKQMLCPLSYRALWGVEMLRNTPQSPRLDLQSTIYFKFYSDKNTYPHGPIKVVFLPTLYIIYQ